MSNEWVDTVMKAAIVRLDVVEDKDLNDDQLLVKALLIELAKKRWRIFWSLRLKQLRQELALAKLALAQEELVAQNRKLMESSVTLNQLLNDLEKRNHPK